MAEASETLKMERPTEFKSIAVRCSYCGKLLEIDQQRMDSQETRTGDGICFDCFKAKLSAADPARKRVLAQKY